MAVMRSAVQLVIDDQRAHEPGVTAIQALEHVLRTGKLHHIHTTDPISRAYAAVLRHPRQARFDAKEIERHERDSHD
jgi:hypothetical protein